MAITELTRACICHNLVTDPASTLCDRCDRILVPHVSTWPVFLKWWALRENGVRRFHSWISEQEWLERLVRDAMVGSGGIARPNPRGVHFTTTSPIADLYPRALQLATAWKADGSPIAPAIHLETKRSA